LLESRASYFQVAFIGTRDKGREMVRANQLEGIISETSKAQLQQMGDKFYIKEALALPPGKIFISGINLYKENGAIYTPHLPSIMAALPVYGQQSQVIGILQVYMDLSPTFNNLKALAGQHTSLYLTNNLGDYLIHPQSGKSFGFELGKRWLLQHDFPQGNALLSGTTSSLQAEEAYTSEKEPVLLNLERIYIFNDHDRFLILGMSSPHSIILAGIKEIRNNSFTITLLICLGGILLTLIFSRFLIQPLQQITHAVSQFAYSKETIMLPQNRSDEIGVLAKTFNAMSLQLKNQIQELEYKEESISAIIETTIEAILIFNVEGIIEKCNKAAEEIFGFAAAELLGKNIQLILTNLSSPIEKVVGIGRETTAKCKDGSMIYVYMALSEFKVDTETKYTAIIHDITARKQVEAELIIAKQCAEEANKAKDEFLSVMSHEIRTPMNAVIGMTKLLLQNEPSKKQLPIIHTLQFSAANLMSLINDILDYSKIQAGKIEFEKVDFNLAELLNKITLSYQPKADEKGLILIQELETDVPQMVKGDSVRLYQILNNLVANAVKFTEKGNITIHTYRIKKEDTKKLHLVFEIEDTGIGIAPDRMAAIFDRFTQGSSDTTRKYGGSGLGLAITKNLVELQGGTIELETTFGVGSTFKVYLHFEHSSATVYVQSTHMTPAVSVSSVRGLRILYIEDVPYNQFLIENYVEKWEIQLDIASSGAEGIVKARQNTYDLILMDIQMPEMDGYQATAQIRTFNKITPIIAITALVSDQAKGKILECGMNDYILKPVDQDELLQKIAVYTSAAALPEKSGKKITTNKLNNQLPFFTALEEAYDHDTVKIKKALQMIKGEFIIYKEKFLYAIQQQNLNEFGSNYHKIKPHIQLLQLDNLDKQLAMYKTANKTLSEAEILKICQALTTSFDKLIEAIHERINSTNEQMV
jgi:PAS domain S-box-containing protein